MQKVKNEKSKSATKISDELVNIRVSRATRENLYQDLKKIRQKGGSKKITVDELIVLGQESITDTQIQKLSQSSRTNVDKEKLIFDIYKSKNKGTTLDEFKGKLLFGELTTFIQENCQNIIGNCHI